MSLECMNAIRIGMRSYQEEAVQTAIYPAASATVYPTIGLSGEVGEVSELVKKAIRDDGGRFSADRTQRLKYELGDCLWYLANIADDLGLDLGDIAAGNLDKLRNRQERGVLHGSGDDR